MNNKLCYSALLGTALLLTGCGKKMNQFQADYFKVNPNPLEVVGDKVPATVTGNIPGKFFQKNAEVTVTPYQPPTLSKEKKLEATIRWLTTKQVVQ